MFDIEIVAELYKLRPIYTFLAFKNRSPYYLNDTIYSKKFSFIVTYSVSKKSVIPQVRIHYIYQKFHNLPLAAIYVHTHFSHAI